jgi:chloride channel 3/4/5
LVVIILELTGDMAYSVPTAITVLVAKAVAEMIESEGIYDLVIRMNKFPYLDAKKQHIFGSHRVVDMVCTASPELGWLGLTDDSLESRWTRHFPY